MKKVTATHSGLTERTKSSLQLLLLRTSWRDQIKESIKQKILQNPCPWFIFSSTSLFSPGRPSVKVIWTSLEATDLKLEFRRNNKAEKAKSVEFGNVTRFGDAEALIIGKPGQYNVYLNGSEIAEYDFKQGANYNLLLRGNQIVIHQVIHKIVLFEGNCRASTYFIILLINLYNPA